METGEYSENNIGINCSRGIYFHRFFARKDIKRFFISVWSIASPLNVSFIFVVCLC